MPLLFWGCMWNHGGGHHIADLHSRFVPLCSATHSHSEHFLNPYQMACVDTACRKPSKAAHQQPLKSNASLQSFLDFMQRGRRILTCYGRDIHSARDTVRDIHEVIVSIHRYIWLITKQRSLGRLSRCPMNTAIASTSQKTLRTSRVASPHIIEKP